MKCDQGRPSCYKCTSTGRTCDGYGIWGGGGNPRGAVGELAAAKCVQLPCQQPQTIRPRLSPSSFPNLQQTSAARALCYFQRYTTVKFSGLFESQFWSKLVLQACFSEPAAFHAATALGATHQNDFTLSMQEQNKSMMHLRRKMRNKDKNSLDIALITCLLYVCLELMKGDLKAGQVHLHNGRAILQEAQRQDRSVDGVNILVLNLRHNSTNDYIAESFARMTLQSALFDRQLTCLYGIDLASGLKSLAKYDIPQAFSTLAEARCYLDCLTNSIYALEEEASNHHNRDANLPTGSWLALSRRQIQLQSLTQQWLASFQRSDLKMPTPQNFRLKLGAPLLLLYHEMLTIMIATCGRGFDETVFDLHHSEFTSMVERAEKICRLRLEVLKQFFPAGHHIPKVRFSADMGVIPPLYFVALKCRDLKLRNRAIAQLRDVPHREGVWDGVLASKIAQRVADLEYGVHAGIRHMNRVRVELATPPDETVSVLCERFAEGEWKTCSSKFRFTFMQA